MSVLADCTLCQAKACVHIDITCGMCGGDPSVTIGRLAKAIYEAVRQRQPVPDLLPKWEDNPSKSAIDDAVTLLNQFRIVER